MSPLLPPTRPTTAGPAIFRLAAPSLPGRPVRHLRAAAIVFAIAAGPAGAQAHGAGHLVVDRVLPAGAAAVEFTGGTGEPIANAAAQVFGPGDETPFQRGHTDGHGRMAFVADRAGDWRVELTDADGHGAIARLTVGAESTVAATPSWRQWLLRGSLLANALLAGLLLQLLVARRTDPQPSAPAHPSSSR